MSSPWPLPATCYFLPDLEWDPGEARERTEVDEGPPMQRPTASDPIPVVTGSVIVSLAELQTFLEWGRVALGNWSLPFDWLEPIQDLPARYQFRSRPRISGVRTAATPYADRKWRVSFVLERLP